MPPQEPEEVRQQFVSPAVARKHYKIIFIKTPNVQPSAAQIALQQSQSEEKTIVYVLVKKPEDQGDISIPQLPQLPPSKPEVYFIKYKANRGGSSGAVTSLGGAGSSFDAAGGFGGTVSGGASSAGQQYVSGGSSSSSGAQSVGFDASFGAGASSGASSQASGSK